MSAFSGHNKPRNKPGGAKPGSGKPQADRPYGAKPGGKPQADRHYGAKPGGKPQADRPYSDKPQAAGKPSGKPQADRPYSAKPGGKPQADRPYSDKPQAAGKPGGRPYGAKPGGKPQAQKPYARQPYASRAEDKEQRPVQADSADQEQNEDNGLICGRHAVLEALKSGLPINKVLLAESNEQAFQSSVFKLCQERDIPCRQLPKQQLTALAGPDHRGVAAYPAAAAYVELEDILARASERGEHALIVLLDGVEDPHNLGAIIRSAHSLGAHGLVIGKRRSAALNATVMKTSAGAAAYLPVARVTNLNQALKQLQQAGCWAVAADMQGQPLWSLDLSGPLALVLGSEGQGIAPLLKQNCDYVAAIPMQGEIGSLNVSNAAAILLYETLRQRRG